MKSLLRNTELFYLYFTQFLKVRFSFKGDFLVGAFVSVLLHVITIFTLDAMFSGYPTLNEWTREEIFFIYALCAIPLDIFRVFFTNLYMLSRTYIVEGELDRLLLRPVNPLLQFFMERIELEKIPGIIVGFMILFYASHRLEIVWTPLNILFLAAGLVCGVIIYTGVFLAISCLGFWMPDKIGILPPVWNLVSFGRYPVDIYNYLVRFIICFVIPFAFVGFFPASQIMGHVEFKKLALLTPFVAFICALTGYVVWLQGLKKYESTGH